MMPAAVAKGGDSDGDAHVGSHGDVLAALRVLVGEDDVKLDVQQPNSTPDAVLQQRLKQRLERAQAKFPALEVLLDDAATAQQTTGAAALQLLVRIHQHECAQRATSTASSAATVTVDPALARPLRKLVSLASRWAIVPALLHFDRMYSRSQPLVQADSEPNRIFDPAELATAANDAELAYNALASILNNFRAILPQAHDSGKVLQSLSINSQAARISLELCASEILDLGFRLTKPFSRSQAHESQTASTFVGLVLRSLATSSAFSSLSGVGRFKPNYAGDGTEQRLAPATTPSYVLQLTKRMSALQLLRPDGVDALLRSSLENAEARPDLAQNLASYQNVNALSAALTTAPAGVPPELFIQAVLPQLMAYLKVNVSTAGSQKSPQLTVVVLALSRLSRKHSSALREALELDLYRSFRPTTTIQHSTQLAESQAVTSSKQVATACRLLRCIVEHAEPSSDFLRFLLSPIIGPFFALLDHLIKSSPTPSVGSRSSKGKVRVIGDRTNYVGQIRDEIETTLRISLEAWIRLSPVDELVEEIGTKAGSLLDRLAHGRLFAAPTQGQTQPSAALSWVDDEEGISLRVAASQEDSLARLLQHLPANLSAGITLSKGADLQLPHDLASAFSVRPSTITKLLKDTNRADVARQLLQQVLDTYVGSRAQLRPAEDSTQLDMRPVLYLQMIAQLLDTFGEELLKGHTKSTLAFIDYTLPRIAGGEKATQAATSAQSSPALQGLMNIGQAPSQANAETVDASVDDETVEPEAITTALELLLAMLEGEPSLSPHTTPMLVVIEAKISPLLSSPDEDIRRLSQEAMLVLKARKASQTVSPPSAVASTARPTPRSKALSMYQEALKLLQDPILPVRAHGLVILRELVSEPRPGEIRKSKASLIVDDAADPAPSSSNKAADNDDDIRPEVDEALLPAILDIFVQAIQDEESYLYLNAVQGLAAMAVSGGSQVLRALVGKYVGADERIGRDVAQAEVDRRLRIGEALLRVIQRCGSRLGPDVSIVVRPLLTMLRNAHEPTALRSSAISLLGTCVEAAPLAMASAGFAQSLTSICLDIVALETTERSQPRTRAKKTSRPAVSVVKGTGLFAGIEAVEDDDEADDEPQPQPESATATDTKLPQLRRAALFLLTLLLSGTNAVLQRHLEDRRESAQSTLLEPPGREASLSALRLPGGASLPILSSDSSTLAPRKGDAFLPPLLFEPKLLEHTKTVAKFVNGRDADAVVRVQAEEVQRECDELELNLVHIAASA